MLRKLTVLLAALVLPASALAEVYSGVTAALSTIEVSADASGTLTALNAAPGERVEAGQELMSLSPERVFAATDGAVSLIYADEGEAVDGTVLEVMPSERYLIYCTVDNAYQSAESTLVHSGEAVYVRCTSDGTHRAVGLLYAIDGNTYRVVTRGGELYVGETVYLYRDPDFTAGQRIGIGTVVSNDTNSYKGSGTLTRLRVDEGDLVERGQLLYELNGGSATAPVSGILTAVGVQIGESVTEGQALAEIVPDGQVCVELRVTEADVSRFSPGATALLTLACDADGEPIAATVLDCSHAAEDGAYTVRLLPNADVALPLGMSVTVRI